MSDPIIDWTPLHPQEPDRKALARNVISAAERMEMAHTARGIPTGELYRGIAENEWQRTRVVFREAVAALAGASEPSLRDALERICATDTVHLPGHEAGLLLRGIARRALAGLCDVPLSKTPPDGWQMVPIKPTQSMCQAGQWKALEWPKFPLQISPIWQAMLDAAPSQEPTK